MNCDLIYIVMYLKKTMRFSLFCIFRLLLRILLIHDYTEEEHFRAHFRKQIRRRARKMYIMYKNVRNTLTNYGGFRYRS